MSLLDHTLYTNYRISIDTLLCPKSIVYDLCSHISVQGKWLVLSCPLFGGFTGLEHNIGCQILGGLEPPSPYAPGSTLILLIMQERDTIQRAELVWPILFLLKQLSLK